MIDLVAPSKLGREPVGLRGVDSTVPRRPGFVSRLLTVALTLAVGCAHGAKRERAASAGLDAPWIDGAPLVGEPLDTAVLDALANGSPPARVSRLDRLIDLFDAARFAEDEFAREALWAALGGHSLGIGPEATREATGRLLQEALAIEELAGEGALGEDHRRFLTDAIMMLSVDLELPVTAEGLSIRTLAYRTLVEQGHARIVGNARWRLYDHVRGTLEGAANASPRERMDVAVQALYAERDEVDAWLAETVPHARPPWPTPSQLWASLQRQRDALAALPGWASVVATRVEADEALRETVLTVLPAPRDAAWPLATGEPGQGREESLAPVLLVTEDQVTVDAGRPRARAVALEDDPARLASSLRGVLVQDGRGIVLLAADPGLPSPQLNVVLQALRQAEASRIELAIREPRLGEDEEAEPVIVALALEVVHPQGDRPRASTIAIDDARISVHLSGRGPRFAIDGRALSTEASNPRELASVVRALMRAYPRERVVRLSLGSDVMLQQLVELLAALQGGPDRPFAAVGWHVEDASSSEPSDAHARVLRTRADAYWPKPGVDLVQAYPLHGDDQKRLEAFAATLGACVPELERTPPASLRLDVAFHEGRLIEVHGPKLPRLSEPHGAAVRSCVEDLALPFRLGQHRDRVEIGIVLSPGL
jgi:hypothetical protein